ncbi:hypothetical protein D1007_03915 [Hordeum vulgare]|nr:hypothetical protein D1007_03915 [Hordeum vulgare]
MLLLSVWSWERLLVGRPREVTFKDSDDHDNHVWLPTWAYKWEVVSEVKSDVNILYKQYTNEMDSPTAEQVEWQPYGVGASFVEFHLPHSVLDQFGLFQGHPPEWVDTDAQLHRLDRRRQRNIKDWNKHRKKYVTMFEQSVEEARSMPGTQVCEHCPLAFNNYVRWFQENTRVDIWPPAFHEDILEDRTSFHELTHGEYNKLIRKGYQTPFAPVLNFVLKEIKKQADKTEAILDRIHRGKKGESALDFSSRNTLDDSNTSGARMDDGDITSTAHLEDDVFSREVQDDMTLEAFERSAYMSKPRRGFKRFTPGDYMNKGKKPVSEGSRMTEDVTWMRGIDNNDDDDDELEDPQPVVRMKLPSKRG